MYSMSDTYAGIICYELSSEAVNLNVRCSWSFYINQGDRSCWERTGIFRSTGIKWNIQQRGIDGVMYSIKCINGRHGQL
jgi:hypothetical protein